MRKRQVVGAVACCLNVAVAANDAPEAAFWAWFEQYGDEQGEVFDPVALIEMTLAMDGAVTPQGTNELHEVKQHAETPSRACTADDQSSHCRRNAD